MTMTKEEWKESFKLKYKHFTWDERDAAQGWTNCAIGCRLKEEFPDIDIKKSSMRKLLTPKAHRLGRKFFDYVDDNNVEKAEKTFNEIQLMDEIVRDENKTYHFWDAYL